MKTPSRDAAQWKARFRAPSVRFVQYAAANPCCGLVALNTGAAHQLCAWRLDSDTRAPLPIPAEREFLCWPSADGRHVYYLRDDHGNDTGHYVRIPFEGGEPEDITPELPPYSSFGVLFSRSAHLCGFSHSDDTGAHVRVVDLGPKGCIGSSRVIYEGQGMAIADWGLTYEGTTVSGKALTVAYLGGTPGQKPDLYRSRSPITYAERIEAPLLVIHGRHDTHAPARQMERFIEQMRSLGKDIEAVWFASGHSGPFADLEEGIRHQEIMLRFALRALQDRQ